MSDDASRTPGRRRRASRSKKAPGSVPVVRHAVGSGDRSETETRSAAESDRSEGKLDDYLVGLLRPFHRFKLNSKERYEIIAEHGRGGLGRVVRARDQELCRDVALKELLRPTHDNEVRFVREALITARLEHPGVVPVHEAGRGPDRSEEHTSELQSL